MELIKFLEGKKDNSKWRYYGIFLCAYCNKEVIKILGAGKKAKSCGCMQSEFKKGKNNPMFNKIFTDEHRKNLSISGKGRKHTDETKKKISEALKGANNGMYGKHLTEEVKNKISISNLNKVVTDISKQKVSLANSGANNGMFGKFGEEHPMYGKHHTEEVRQKISAKSVQMWRDSKIREKLLNSYPDRSGKNHPNWQGGKSFEPYSPKFNKFLKKSILERDSYKCKNPSCLNKSKKLDIHHINYDKKNSALNNLITLCGSCHGKTKGKKCRDFWAFFYNFILGVYYAI